MVFIEFCLLGMGKTSVNCIVKIAVRGCFGR